MAWTSTKLDLNALPGGASSTNYVSAADWNGIATSVSGRGLTVKDFGAVGDGTADDTAALQSALDSVKTGGRVVVPVGRYKITSTLLVTNGWSFTLAGTAGTLDTHCSQILWAGPAGDSAMKLINCRDVEVRDLHIAGNASAKARAMIEVKRDAGQPQTYAPTGNRFINLWLNEVTGGSDYGIAYTCAAASDTNNDLGTFQNVIVSKASIAGLWFAHAQSKAHLIIGGSLSESQYGISTYPENSGNGGSFRSYGTNFSAHSVADVYLGGPNDNIVLSGFQSEGSSRLMLTGGPTGNLCPVTVEGGRWSPDALNADHQFIAYKFRGPLIVRGNLLGNGGSVTPIVGYYNSGPGTLELVGNSYASIGSDTATLVAYGTSDLSMSIHSNSLMDAGGVAIANGAQQLSVGLFSGTAAPTTGKWVIGSRMLNSNPSVGQPKGWVCVYGGSPGTWVTEGTLLDTATFAPVSNPIDLVTISGAGQTVAVDASQYAIWRVQVTTNDNFTIGTPTNFVSGQIIIFEVYNASGGAMGTVTWDTPFHLAGSAWANPASGGGQSIAFMRYTPGGIWRELWRGSANVF